VSFISSLPQLAWDKRLSCCCCCSIATSHIDDMVDNVDGDVGVSGDVANDVYAD
jgi:hypothetical protein